MTGNHINISRKNYRVSQKKSVLLSDLLKENVEPITITNACQVFFGSPCRESVEENLFSLATITVSYFFFLFKKQ